MVPSKLHDQLRRSLARVAAAARQELEGQGLVEYALILSLVVLVAFVVIVWLGPWVGNVFSNVVNNL
ncbi:MAG: Flp family type IVb pilin [Anaerolineae bacterium]|nr:Flp family type IVb pilin [Anaerolineae bacterium]